MSFASIAVHIGVARDPDKRLRLSVDLALRFKAALIGVCGCAPRPPMTGPGIVVDPQTIERELEDATSRLATAQRRFRDHAKVINDVEWRGGLEFPTEMVVSSACSADLVVLGRNAVDAYISVDPGNAILRTGRPVLLVPDAIDSLSPRRVLIAWKDTKEARRAVRDAIPFLQEAEEVSILQVNKKGAEGETLRQLDDVAKYLARHRVVAGVKTIVRTKKYPGNEILRWARDENVGLIVAGGYGHSQLGEWVFGGVTRELIADSPVCCLFSH